MNAETLKKGDLIIWGKNKPLPGIVINTSDIASTILFDNEVVTVINSRLKNVKEVKIKK